MSFDLFAADLRLIAKLKYFQEGPGSSKTIINDAIDAINRIKEAADRRAGDGAGVPATEFLVEVSEAGSTSEFWVTMRRNGLS